MAFFYRVHFHWRATNELTRYLYLHNTLTLFDYAWRATKSLDQGQSPADLRHPKPAANRLASGLPTPSIIDHRPMTTVAGCATKTKDEGQRELAIGGGHVMGEFWCASGAATYHPNPQQSSGATGVRC
jgi:hypothetical protein